MTLRRRQIAAALPLWAALPARSSALRPAPPAEPSLAGAFAQRATPMPFGAAVTPAQLRDPALAVFIRHHFKLLVAENAMKMEALLPDASGGDWRYDWREADALVNFGQAHQMPVRGHTLVWHNQVSAGFFKDGDAEVSLELLIARLQRYIGDVVGHFKGRVFAWDVVNEAFLFDEPGADASGMRPSPWLRIIGPAYIEIAFRAAAQADPGALLFYNDYETQDPRKVRAVLRMVQRLRAEGVRIDGIGHQMHVGRRWPPVRAVADALKAYEAAGLQQHITEWDVALNDVPTGTVVKAATPALLQAQARRYGELMQLFLAHPGRVTAVLLWGLSDAHTWLSNWPVARFEAPLPFDRTMRPKPAYFALLAAARTAPAGP